MSTTTTRAAAAIAAGALTALAIAACGSTTQSKTADGPATHTAAPAASPAATHSTPAADSHTGGIGTHFEVTTTDDNGGKVKYVLTLVRFKQHAAPSDSFEAASAGSHLAAAEFQIGGLEGHASGNVNNTTTANGSDSQTLTPSFDSVAAGSNFNDGDFEVAPAQVKEGWVVFEVKDGVRVVSVEWSASDYMDGEIPATWTLRH